MAHRSTHAGFADIEFGFADAEKESAENPDLLLVGFFDDSHLVDKALKGTPFLFLGYKGSGKTAVAERAHLLAQDDSSLFVTIEQLADFSYADFKNAAGGSGDHQTRYPTAWGYLLLLSLIQSLELDEGAKQLAPPEYTRVISGLGNLGLLPAPRLGDLVVRSSRKTLKGGVGEFLQGVIERVEESHDLRMAQMVNVLQRCVEHFPTKSRHVVFIDGLDSVISQRDLQFQSLAALMREVDRLNNHFKRRAQPFKFVVLCRTDIFDRLPGANTNKIRQDSGLELDWYDDPRHPERTRLVKLANLRARTSLRRSVDVFREYLPPKVDGRPTRAFLLDHTRHTPRDMLQLLKRLQAHTGTTDRLSPEQVKSGVRDYSNNYFILEMRNELAGYLADDQVDQAITLLTSMRRPRIEYPELQQRAAELGYRDLDVDALARALFNCSALGTVDESNAAAPLYTFKYRNRTATLIPGSVIQMHPGALKGLNIEPKPRRQRGAGRRGSAVRRGKRGPTGGGDR